MGLGLGIGLNDVAMRGGAAFPSLNLDSNNGSLEDQPFVNLSRSSEQTYFDSNGILQTAPANTLPPSYEYNPYFDRWERKGWYIGEERENLILDSRDLTTGNWNIPGAPTVLRDAVGIDAQSNTACTINDTGTSFERVEQSISISNDNNTYNIHTFIKKDTDQSRFPALRVVYSGGTGLEHRVQINTETGDIADETSNGTSSVYDFGTFWLLNISMANNGTGNTTMTVGLFPADGISLGISDSNATGSAIFDQVQVEQASFPSPPIITGGSTVTRSATLADITDLSWYNQDEGTFVVKFSSDVESGDTVGILRNSGSDNINPIYINSGAVKSFNGVTGGVSIAAGSAPYGGVACVGYNSSGRVISWNGSVDENSNDFIDSSKSLDGIAIGRSLNTSYLNGGLEYVKYYPKRLSNSQLQSLTS